MNGTLRICAEHASKVQSKKRVLVKQLCLEIAQELLQELCTDITLLFLNR